MAVVRGVGGGAPLVEVARVEGGAGAEEQRERRGLLAAGGEVDGGRLRAGVAT